MLALLVLLAGLQYRWTGELSNAESERIESLLRSSSRNVAFEIDREVTRVFVHFQPSQISPRSEVKWNYGSLLRRWEVTAPYPALVRDVFRARLAEGGGWELSRLNRGTSLFEPATWPTDLVSVRQGLARLASDPPRDHQELLGLVPVPLAPSVPAVVLPFEDPNRRARGSDLRALRSQRELPGPPLTEFVVVRLNLDFLRRSLLPELVARHFATDSRLEYDVVVRTSDALDSVLYQSDPLLSAEELRTPDLETRLFSLLPVEEMPELYPEGRASSASAEARGLRLGTLRWASIAATNPSSSATGWSLLVQHRAGSLEDIVSRHRARNLAVVLGILALLGGSLAMALASSRRAQELATQRMEFVAGVSHELRTPLAVIRSLSQNMSDGLVHADEQIRNYGTALEAEERRLSRMVEQVLDFAQPRPGLDPTSFRRVDPQTIVEHALADSEALLERCSTRTEITVPAELPEVLADPDTLSRAVRNLIDTAAKSGGSVGWVGMGLSAGDGEQGPEVLITVSDHGPGIDRGDRAHLFEPFFRSLEVRQAQIPGSGLGLSVVKRIVDDHGGRVGVRSSRGEGSSFTIHLPAVRSMDEQTDTDR